MRRRFKQAAAIFLGLLLLAQVVRPGRENPPIDEALTIQAGTSTDLGAVLDRACGDCHSNATVWPWYTEVAPLSWLMAYGVREGRRAVNFSVWATYTPQQRRALLAASCQDATEGTMPGTYALLKPATRLSARDVETICSAAQLTAAGLAEGH